MAFPIVGPIWPREGKYWAIGQFGLARDPFARYCSPPKTEGELGRDQGVRYRL